MKATWVDVVKAFPLTMLLHFVDNSENDSDDLFMDLSHGGVQ